MSRINGFSVRYGEIEVGFTIMSVANNPDPKISNQALLVDIQNGIIKALEKQCGKQSLNIMLKTVPEAWELEPV